MAGRRSAADNDPMGTYSGFGTESHVKQFFSEVEPWLFAAGLAGGVLAVLLWLAFRRESIGDWLEHRSDPEWRRGRSGQHSGPPEVWSPKEWKGWLSRQRSDVRWDKWDFHRDYNPNYKRGQSISMRKLCWCPEFVGRRWNQEAGKYFCTACGGESVQI